MGIPLRKLPPAPAPVAGARADASAARSVSGLHPVALLRSSILFVCADADLRARIVGALGGSFRLHVAEDAWKAAELLGQVATPKLVLVDASTRGLDLRSFARALKSSHELARVPLVSLHERGAVHEVLAAMDAGARVSLEKTITDAELRRRFIEMTATP